MCKVCQKLGRTCTMCAAERERAKRQVCGVIVSKEQREAREQEVSHG